MKTHVNFILFALLLSCAKQFDHPPLSQANPGERITIAQIKNKYRSNASYKFRNDSNLYCVVTADEVSGNLYKEVYLRDGSGAIHAKLKYSGGLYIGDSIRINLKGLILNEYNRLIQLDSLDLEKNVVKLVSGLNPKPQRISLQEILANSSATNTAQSKLVLLENVEFAENDRDVSFADAYGKNSKNLILRACSGETITVRTSGYASFASALSPSGKGSLIAIVSQYGDKTGDQHLLIRRIGDLNMNGANCSVQSPVSYLIKDFNDNSVGSGNWTEYRVKGNISWTTSLAGGAPNPYAQISNYISPSNQECETWLISPAIDLSAALKPVLTFRNAYKYTGAPLEVYVSTTYSSGNPNSFVWTKLSFTLSGGNWIFVSSGNISLSSFKSAGTRIAFKYTGSNADGSNWELDDVNVKEE